MDSVLKFITLVSISILTYKRGYLDRKGVITAFLLGSVVIYFGGWIFFFLLLVFMLVGSILTKIVNRKSVDWVSYFNNGGIRSWKNVIANGFWPMYASTLYAILPRNYGGYILFFFLGSLTSMVSDTVSTEVGMYFGGDPVLITNPKIRVPKGYSGGVSLPGLLGGLISSILFSYLASILLGIKNIVSVYSLAVAGFSGGILDSLLGATIQAKYKCKYCGMIVETKYHCGNETELIKGFEPLDNHMVNFISSLLGGIIAFIFYYLLH